MLRFLLVAVLSMGAVPAHALPPDPACRIPATHDADVARTVYEVGTALRVSPKVMLAGFEAGWVESHMNNLGCGDRDSLGVFQQRPSMGWGTPEQIMHVPYAAERFFRLAQKLDRIDLTPGLLADAVQRSCCPERYDQALPHVEPMILQALQGGPEVTAHGTFVVRDGDVWADRERLSTSRDFVGRPAVAGRLVFARNVRGEVEALVAGAWRQVASGVAGDPEAVVRPDGTVALYAVLVDGSVNVMLGGHWQPLSAAGFAAGRPSVLQYPDGSAAVYVRSGGALMSSIAGVWSEVAAGLTGSPEVVLRPDGTIGFYAVLGGQVHRLGQGWEPMSGNGFIDSVSALPDDTVYARKADGSVWRV